MLLRPDLVTTESLEGVCPVLEPRTNVPVEILLVEDTDDHAKLMIDALEEGRLNTHITCVDNGEEALDYLQHKGKHADAVRPQLILLDLLLPRMNGHEVLAVVKDDAALRRIPIVIMTASEDEDEFRKAYNLHANCCVPKPKDQEEFKLAVKKIEQFWLKNLDRR